MAYAYCSLSTLERTGFSYGFSMLMIVIAELLGFKIIHLIINRVPRKVLLGISIVIRALAGFCFAIKSIEESPIACSLLLLLIFFADTANFAAISLLETESFSSDYQSTCIGITFATSHTSRFFLPFLIGAMNEISVHPLVPCAFILLLLGLVPMMFLRESVGVKEDYLY